jgi:hypothetical protein
MSSSEEQSQSETQKQKQKQKQTEIVDLTIDQQQQQQLERRNNTKIKAKIFESTLYYEKRVVNLTVKQWGTEDDDDKPRKRKFSKTKETEDLNDYFFLFKFTTFFNFMKFVSKFISKFKDSKSLLRYITTYEKIDKDVYKDNKVRRMREIEEFTKKIYPIEKKFEDSVNKGNLEGLIKADLIEGDEEGDGLNDLTWLQFNHSISINPIETPNKATTGKASSTGKANTGKATIDKASTGKASDILDKVFFVYGKVYEIDDPIPDEEYHLYIHPSMFKNGCNYMNEILNSVIIESRLFLKDDFHVLKSILEENTKSIRDNQIKYEKTILKKFKKLKK